MILNRFPSKRWSVGWVDVGQKGKQGSVVSLAIVREIVKGLIAEVIILCHSLDKFQTNFFLLNMGYTVYQKMQNF
jgi:hypothetical protein